MEEKGFEMGNQYEREDAEIDFKQVLAEILASFRKLLLTGLLFALLLGLISLGLGFLKTRDKELTAELNQQNVERLNAYKVEKSSYQKQIRQLQNMITQKEKYRRESLLMKLDASSFYEGDISFYITTNYKIDPNLSMQDPDRTQSVLAAYVNLLGHEDLYQEIYEKSGRDVRPNYLKELVSVGVDPGSGLLNIMIAGDTPELVNTIGETIIDYLEKNKEEVASQICPHDLTLLQNPGFPVTAGSNNEHLAANNASPGANGSSSNPSSASDGSSAEGSSVTSFDVAGKQKSYFEQVNGLQTSLSDVQKALLKLQRPKDSGLTPRHLAKNAVKFGILGMILGIFLAAAAILCRFVAEDPLVDEDGSAKRFGLNVLGGRKRFSGRELFSKLMSQLSGDNGRSRGEEAFYRISAENARAILHVKGESSGKLLIVGHEDELLREAERRFKELFPEEGCLAAGNILSDPDAISALSEGERVILLERRGAVSNRGLQREAEKLRALGKEIVGLMLY